MTRWLRELRAGPELRLLRAERLATVPVPGTRAGTGRTQPAGTDLGKPRYAHLIRELPIEPGTDPGTVLADAVRLARADGWVVPDQSSTGTWTFDKVVERARLHGGVTVQDIGGGPALVIYLTYR